MRAYIKVLNGSLAVFSTGVVDKGALVFQQHLDAVNRPGSDASSQDRQEQRYYDAGSRDACDEALADTPPAEELLQHHVGDRRGQDAHPDGEEFPSHTSTERFEHISSQVVAQATTHGLPACAA